MMSVADAIAAATQADVKKDIRDSWALVAGDCKNGVALMIKLFEMEPNSKPFFKRLGDVSDPWNNSKLNGHGITLWYGLHNFVDQLDSATDLEDVARKFAVNHKDRKVGATEFNWIKGPIAAFLKEKMGSKYSDNVVESWGKLIDVIAAVLAE